MSRILPVLAVTAIAGLVLMACQKKPDAAADASTSEAMPQSNDAAMNPPPVDTVAPPPSGATTGEAMPSTPPIDTPPAQGTPPNAPPPTQAPTTPPQ